MLLKKKIKIVQLEFTCLHLSLVPLFRVRIMSSITNSVGTSTFVKLLSISKHLICFPHRPRVSSVNMLSAESFVVRFVAQGRDHLGGCMERFLV